MKHFVLLLSAALLLGGTASAQRLMFGVRGGVNFSDYTFSAVRVDDVRFTPGPSQAGYEVGLVLRLNFTRHLHLQSELNYAFVNYQIRADGGWNHQVRVRTERLQLPVELGLQFGVLRLFGGAQFRLGESQHSSAPSMLKVGFNDSAVALVGGAGINVGKFFLDFRLTGYPRSHVWQHFTSGDQTVRVKVPHDIVYGGSLGFFF